MVKGALTNKSKNTKRNAVKKWSRKEIRKLRQLSTSLETKPMTLKSNLCSNMSERFRMLSRSGGLRLESRRTLSSSGRIGIRKSAIAGLCSMRICVYLVVGLMTLNLTSNRKKKR